MSESGSPEHPSLTPDEMRERTRVQIGIIEEALDDVGVAIEEGDDTADFLYLYRRMRLLVRDVDVDRVVAALEDQAAVEHGLVNGITRLVLSTAEDVPEVLELLDERLGSGVATPDHVLYVNSTGGSCCPATEPLEPGTNQPVPAVNTVATDGQGVFVSVVDTGWHPDAENHPDTPWLAGVTGDPDNIDPKDIQTYGGHGTFIAGVVRCMAPSTTVRVEGFLPNGGAAFESDMVVQLCEALALGPDIISLSAGTTTRGDLPLLSFEVFWDGYLRHVKGTVLVAAAGNDSTRAPFWPAAFPWTVSVGAVDAAGRRSWYSNFGSWVDVYALGDDLVNAYPTGNYYAKEPPFQRLSRPERRRRFQGLARWSGTSFATPIVAGRIAARMSRSGLSARLAADQLLAEARANALPGVGPSLQ